MQQNPEGFGAGQEHPLPPVQISYRNLAGKSCRKGLETPLEAGLAAGAGRLGSEAEAVHPWAQEFKYAATFSYGPVGSLNSLVRKPM